MPKPKPSRTRRTRGDSRNDRQPATAAAGTSIDVDVIRQKLMNVATTVHGAMIMGITCESALSHQNGDEDWDIAQIMRIHCSGKLHAVIRETGVILAMLDGKANVDPEGEEIDELFSLLDGRRD